jgi:hypothetical protein
MCLHISYELIGLCDRVQPTVSVGLTQQAIQDAPPYDAAALFDRQQEAAMYEHYGRPRYWVVDPTEQ